MIVRVKFSHNSKIIHNWSLVKADDGWSLSEFYSRIKNGEVPCGSGVCEKFGTFHDIMATKFSSNKIPSVEELMDTPMDFNLRDLNLGHQSVFSNLFAHIE